MKLWNTIREMFKPIPFNPIMQPEDLVCTHEGSSSCPVTFPAKESKKELEERIRHYLFMTGIAGQDAVPWDKLAEDIKADPAAISEALYYLEYIKVVRIYKTGKCPGCVSLRSLPKEQYRYQVDPWEEIKRLQGELDKTTKVV
jgi:hypothetical protein